MMQQDMGFEPMETNMTAKDTILTEKTLKPESEIVQSLLNLRDELWARRKEDFLGGELMSKINSCLYGQYSAKPEYRMDQEYKSK